MPTLNKKLFFRLLAACILLAGGIFALHQVQSGRVNDALRWQSERYAEEGKLDQAIYYLRLYLERAPEDIQAMVRLCDWLETRGNNSSPQLARRLMLYERILRAEPDHPEVRGKAIELCLALRRYHDAEVHIAAQMQAQPDNDRLWLQQGICQQAANQFHDARQSYARAIELSPTNIRAHELLAVLLTQKVKQADAAQAVLDQMIANNAASAEAFLIRARYLRGVGQLDACQADLKQVLYLDPENADALLLSAELFQNQNQIHQVRSILNDACKLYPRDLRMVRALSWLELCIGNRPASIACLERGVQAMPGELDLLTPLADLLIQNGELERVAEIIDRLERNKAPMNQIQYLRARVQMAKQNWPQAIEQLETLRTQAVSLPALAAQVNLLMAICHRKLGNPEQEMAALQRVLATDSTHLSARMGIGNLHLNAGRWDEALQEYTLVTKSPYASLEARLLCLRLKIAKARRDNADIKVWNSLLKQVQQLGQQFRHSVEPVLLASELLRARGDFSTAADLLLEACHRNSGNAQLWCALARAVAVDRGQDAGLRILDDARAILGDAVELRLCRAEFWAASPSLSRLDRLAKLEQAIDSFVDADQQRLLYGLGDIYAGMQHSEGIRRIYLQIAQRVPGDLPIRAALFDLALAEQDAALQSQMLDELNRLPPTGPILAQVLQQRAAIARAKDPEQLTAIATQLDRLSQQQPGLAESRIARAEVAARLGQLNDATQAYRELVHQDRSRLHYVRRYLQFLIQTGQDRLAKQWLHDLDSDPRVGRGHFEQLFAGVTADLDTATFAKILAWVEPRDQNDPMRLAWLGTLLARHGQTDAAIRRYERAIEQAPKLPDPYLHWLAALIAGDQSKSVPTVLSQAQSKLEGKEFYTLCAHTHWLMAEQGQPTWTPALNTPEAVRDYQEACLRVVLARDQFAQAMGLLERFRDAQTSRPQDKAWAERNLALLRAIRGTPEQRLRAVGQLQAEPKQPLSIDDRRAQAGLLTMAYRHLDGPARKAVLQSAIVALRTVTASDQSADSDWFRLAELYRLAGQEENYQQCLQRLIEREAEKLTYRLVYINSLLDQGKLDQARPEVDYLQRHAPSNFQAIQVQARYYALRQQPQRVLSLLESYVRTVEPGAHQAIPRIRAVADTLEQLCQRVLRKDPATGRELAEAAVTKFQACLSTQADALIPLVGLLTQTQRSADAFTLLKRHRERTPARVFANASLMLLRHGAANPAYAQTIQTWLQEALKQYPRSISLRLALGEFYTITREFGRAQATYQAILHDDPQNIVALNNLAWILAPKLETASKAEQYIRQAIAISGPRGELLDTRARVRIAQGNLDEAVQDLHDALSETKTSLRYFHLAMAHLKQSKRSDALEAFRQAQAHGLSRALIHPIDLPTFNALAQQAADG